MTQRIWQLMLIVVGFFLVCLLLLPTNSMATGNGAVSGRAKGLISTVKDSANSGDTVNQTIADTGELPSGGGQRSTSLANVNRNLMDLGTVSASVFDVFTKGSVGKIGGTSFSQATTMEFDLNASLKLNNASIPVSISADEIDAQANAQCKTRGNPPSRFGSTTISSLVLYINGIKVPIGPVTTQPNQKINLRDFVPELPQGVNATLILNEQTKSSSGRTGSITVNALRLFAAAGTQTVNLIISQARAGATCASF